jgi:cephalosporin hydroxylase
MIDEVFLIELEAFSVALKKKITKQGGIASYVDKQLKKYIRVIQNPNSQKPTLEKAIAEVKKYIKAFNAPRLNSYFKRLMEGADPSLNYREIGIEAMTLSGGKFERLHWKGIPLLKNAFDFSLYPMLIWELKPKTIIEIGSGMGGSAIWMADLLSNFELDAKVYSIDLKKPEHQHPNVTFIEGDCNAPEEYFSKEFLASLPHPWLFIEDAHVNVLGVLSYFNTFFKKDDYLYIEDSGIKQTEIAKFIQASKNQFNTDTKFTEFFGRNGTCAGDSILVCL